MKTLNIIFHLVSLFKFARTRIDLSLSEAFKKSRDKYNEAVTRNMYIMGRLISAIFYLVWELHQELPAIRLTEAKWAL
jgi:hypothetical protein